jgi:peptidyl-prolyl cis-trans isomerase C
VLLSKILALAFIAVVAVAGTACKKAATPANSGASTATPTATGTSTPAAAPQPPAAEAPPAPPPALPVPEKLPEVVARVNNEDVRKTDFEMLIRNVEASNGPIPAVRRDEILRRVLDELVNYTLLKQEARARKVTATDAEVEEQIQAMRKSAPSEEAFQKALKDQKMSLDRLRADARAQIAIGKMMNAEVANAQPATDAEAKDFYDKNPDRFKQPELVRASHILIRFGENADEASKKQARAKIDAILKRAKAGEDFAALAKENSEDGSAAQGGDLDFFPKEKMVAPFNEVAFALKTGEMSDVVTTQFGYHIIKTTDRKPATTLPLAEVNEQLKQGLSQQKQQQYAQGFIAQLRQKSKVEVLI